MQILDELQYNPRAYGNPIYNGDIETFSPSSLFSSPVRARKRNLLANIFVSTCFLTVLFFNPNAGLSTLFFFRFDEPLSDLSPIKYLLATHLAYCFLAFLVELYAEMKKVNVSFSGLTPHLKERDFKLRNTQNFRVDVRGKTLTHVDGQIGYEKYLGERFTSINVSTSIHARRLFLADELFIARENFKVCTVSYEGEHLRVVERTLGDSVLDGAEFEYLSRLQETYAKLVMCIFRHHTYYSFPWWYEVFIPLLVSVVLFIMLAFAR
jgi:hypothetical protein